MSKRRYAAGVLLSRIFGLSFAGISGEEIQVPRKKKVLVTAFEPFGARNTNASEEALKLVEVPEGVELVRAVLPVKYAAAGSIAAKLIRREGPDAVLCLGVAGSRNKLTVERVAINICDGRQPDNAGVVCNEVPSIPGAPAAYFATVPVRRIADAINSEGVPADVSNTAGTYICNDVMFWTLHTCANLDKPIPAGFIHIPAAPGEYPDDPDMPVMESGTAAKGIETAVRVIAEFLK